MLAHRLHHGQWLSNDEWPSFYALFPHSHIHYIHSHKVQRSRGCLEYIYARKVATLRPQIHHVEEHIHIVRAAQSWRPIMTLMMMLLMAMMMVLYRIYSHFTLKLEQTYRTVAVADSNQQQRAQHSSRHHNVKRMYAYRQFYASHTDTGREKDKMTITVNKTRVDVEDSKAHLTAKSRINLFIMIAVLLISHFLRARI